jgi:hypothetical protein
MRNKKPKAAPAEKRRTSFALNAEDERRLKAIIEFENGKPGGVTFTQTDILRQALYESAKKRGLEPKVPS